MEREEILAIAHEVLEGIHKTFKPALSIELIGGLDLYNEKMATASADEVELRECQEDEWWEIDNVLYSIDTTISSGYGVVAKRRAAEEGVDYILGGYKANPTGAAYYPDNGSMKKFWVFPGQKVVVKFSGTAAGKKMQAWATGRKYKLARS